MNGRTAIFRRRYVDTNRRRRAVLRRAPVVVDVPIVDIAVELLAPTVELTADTIGLPDTVDIAVEVLPVDAAKIIDVPVVDIVTEILPVDPARFVEVDTVDISVTPMQVTPGGVAPLVDIQVTVLPVDLAKIVDVPVVDIQVTPLAVDPVRVADVPTVDISTVAQPVATFQMDTQPVEIEVQVLPVSVAYGMDDTRAVEGIPITPQSAPTRVLAQNIRTGAWLHTDLPVENLEITKSLSGADLITGSFSAQTRELSDLGLEPWGTWVYVEENGQIRATGILQPTKADRGQGLALEAVGFSSYPQGIPYLGENPNGIRVDPADMVRLIWAHLQSYPDAKLGVEVIGTTAARIGEEQPPEQVEFVTGDGKQVSFQSGGPYTLHWYEAPDCGAEIDDLAKEAPFEYTERSFWNNPATKDFVRKQVVIHYPRAGRRRNDVVFDQEENLLEAIGPEETPNTYASQVVLLGKGEGTSKVRGYAGRALGTRIRRVALVDKKTVESTVRANALSNEELERRQALLDITELVVKARHEYARLGTYEPGDDVPVRGTVPWAGEIDQWERVLAYTYSPGQETVRIQTRRSESFVYGSTD